MAGCSDAFEITGRAKVGLSQAVRNEAIIATNERGGGKETRIGILNEAQFCRM